MSSTNNNADTHLTGVAEMWKALKAAEQSEQVQQQILRWTDSECKEQINAGNYDAAVPLSDLYDRFHRFFVQGNADAGTGDTIDITHTFPSELTNTVASKLLFQQIIDKLVERDALLYVYDKQRVRSRVAEVTRYFALLRQRFNDESDFEHSPSLTKMVKMDIQSREKPKWGEDGIDLTDEIRDILDTIRTADPAPELAAATNTGSWRDATQSALELIYELCKERKMTGLAAFQGRALDRLYRQAVTTDARDTSHVVTASTGGGKTEAFLFPILAYTFTTAHPDIKLDGVDAVLAYPRKDLCDNQFERIVEYLYDLEQIIAKKDTPFDSLPVTVALQHSSAENTEIDCPVDSCDGRISTDSMECSKDPAHNLDFARADKGATADIIVVTPDTLHRRLMDHRGHSQFWKHSSPPKFVVLDEVHVYTNQYGMHVANVMRRFKAALKAVDDQQEPSLVASSATISNATPFTKKIFGTPHAEEITPCKGDECTGDHYKDHCDINEIEEIGWEYLVFIKATDPREVQVPQGEAKYLPRRDWDEDDFVETNVTNLSSMIQVAFSMYHTILKEQPDDGPLKNKILGFVDSIDSVKRLGDYIHDAESDRGVEGMELFRLRAPDAFLREEGENGTNPDCPKHQFRSNAADHERAVCEPLPPNAQLNPCPVYEAGECWWTMTGDLDLEPMDVYMHKSGRTETPDGRPVNDDAWDMMVTTSALEVGFDHPGIMGTFQYRAPMNIPGFVQRKGRGGRDPEDHPISVVVLGSRPEDAFYFHHENLLSNPDPRYLQINLDEENEFVRTEHLVSAIFDYLNVTDHDTADEIYRRLDIDTLDEKLQNQDEIEDWLHRAFPAVDDNHITEVLDEIQNYVTRTQAPLTPVAIGGEMQQFWEAARIPRGTKQSDLSSQLEDLKYKRRLLQDLSNQDSNISIQTDE
jgi:hypothetical protein